MIRSQNDWAEREAAKSTEAGETIRTLEDDYNRLTRDTPRLICWDPQRQMFLLDKPHWYVSPEFILGCKVVPPDMEKHDA